MTHNYGQTWIEPEEYCYSGARRRARVRIESNRFFTGAVPEGEYRMVRCGLPDTFFSIPASLRYKGSTIRGFVSMASQFNPPEGELVFCPYDTPGVREAARERWNAFSHAVLERFRERFGWDPDEWPPLFYRQWTRTLRIRQSI